MAWTAIAITETGEIGQARGRDFTWPRAEGDAVSRYGMGMSLAQLPAAWMAPRIEARLGPGASQPLFLDRPPPLRVRSGGRCRLDRSRSRPERRRRGSRGPADGSRLSSWILRVTRSVRAAPGRRSRTEPGVQPDIESRVGDTEVQPPLRLSRGRRRGNCAAHEIKPRGCDTVRVVAAAQRGTDRSTQSHCLCAGGSGAPVRRLDLLRDRKVRTALRILRRRGIHASMAGWILETARWSQSRAGALLSCARHRDAGLGDLLSAAVTSSAARGRGVHRHLRRVADDRSWMVGLAWALGMGPTAVGAGCALPLAASAAVILDRWPRTARYAVLAASMILNLPGLLQNAAPVTLFAAACQWPAADKAFAESLASYARHAEPDGSYQVAPDQVLETVRARSPFLVYPWFARAASEQRSEERRACSKHLPGSSRDLTSAARTRRRATWDGGLRKRAGWAVLGTRLLAWIRMAQASLASTTKDCWIRW